MTKLPLLRILQMSAILILATACQNPLANSSSSDPQFSPFLPTVPLTAFAIDFDFNNTSTSGVTAGAEIAGGVGRLIISDTLDNATGSAAGDLDFSLYQSADSNLSVATNTVKMTSGTSGVYVSRIMNGMNTSLDWTKLNFVSSLPFGKEIQTSAETGYGSTVANLSSGLVGLWHMNETVAGSVGGNDFADSTSLHNDLFRGGNPTFGAAGIIGGAPSFNGIGFAVSSVAISPAFTNSISQSVWFYPTAGGGTVTQELGQPASNSGWHDSNVEVLTDGTVKVGFWIGSQINISVGNAAFNQWHHVVWRYNGTVLEAFLDGVKSNNTFTGTKQWPTTYYFSIAGDSGTNMGNGVYFNGRVDEVALWNRAVTDAEAGQLYRRGVNRLKFQIRGCTDSTCSANPTWVGVDGTNSTYFTELSSASTTPFSVLWTGISSLGSWLSANKNKQYLQYKAIFETDSGASFPDLSSVSFSPLNRYATGAVVSNLPAAAVTFSQLSGISISEGACTGGTIRYDVGNSVSNFLAWNGSAWVTSTNYASASSKATLEGLSSAQWNSFPKGTGSLYVRAYLASDGLSPCSVSHIHFDGLH